MLQSDKEIIQKSYSLYKQTGDLKASAEKAIGSEKLNNQRLNNIVIALNQSVRANFKKNDEHSKVFTPLTLSDLSSSKEEFKKDVAPVKSDLKGYDSPFSIKKSSNTYNPGHDLFRNIIEEFRKVAAANEQWEVLNSKLGRELGRDYAETMLNIKEASISNSILQVETALCLYSPENKNIAKSLTKSACDNLLASGQITQKQLNDFKVIDREGFLQKIASQEVEVEENKLTESYGSLLCSRDAKTVHESRKSIIEKKASECFKMYETLSGKLLPARMTFSEKLAFVERESTRPYFLNGVEKIAAKSTRYGGTFFENIKNNLPSALAASGIIGGAGMAVDNFKRLLDKDQENKKYYSMIDKNPSLKDTEETREMFGSIVDSNPGMLARPIQTGKMISTLQEQGQIVTPDMMSSLSKGSVKPNGGGFAGDLPTTLVRGVLTSSLGVGK